MRLIAITFILILLASCNSVNTDLSPKNFTKAFLAKTMQQFPNSNAHIADSLSIELAFGTDINKLFLDNAYAEYREDPSAIDLIIEHYLNAAANSTLQLDTIIPSRIIPTIKPKNYLNEHKLLTQGETELVADDLNEELLIVYAEDTETHIKYFSEKEFNKLGIKRDSLRKIAVNNLIDLLPEIQIIAIESAQGILQLSAGGDYDASLVLIDSLWEDESLQVNGELVFVIPTKDQLFITGSNTSLSISKLRNASQNLYNSGNHQISPLLFVRAKNGIFSYSDAKPQ